MSSSRVIPGPRKVLTIHPLWAWAIIAGHKRIENRTWNTTHRGQLVIHASANMREDGLEYVRLRLEAEKIDYPETIDVGAIVGTVDLVGVVKGSKDRFASPGHFHWQFANPRACKPVDVKGSLGLWNLPAWVKVQPCD